MTLLLTPPSTHAHTPADRPHQERMVKESNAGMRKEEDEEEEKEGQKRMVIMKRKAVEEEGMEVEENGIEEGKEEEDYSEGEMSEKMENYRKTERNENVYSSDPENSTRKQQKMEGFEGELLESEGEAANDGDNDSDDVFTHEEEEGMNNDDSDEDDSKNYSLDDEVMRENDTKLEITQKTYSMKGRLQEINADDNGDACTRVEDKGETSNEVDEEGSESESRYDKDEEKNYHKHEKYDDNEENNTTKNVAMVDCAICESDTSIHSGDGDVTLNCASDDDGDDVDGISEDATMKDGNNDDDVAAGGSIDDDDGVLSIEVDSMTGRDEDGECVSVDGTGEDDDVCCGVQEEEKDIEEQKEGTQSNTETQDKNQNQTEDQEEKGDLVPGYSRINNVSSDGEREGDCDPGDNLDDVEAYDGDQCVELYNSNEATWVHQSERGDVESSSEGSYVHLASDNEKEGCIAHKRIQESKNYPSGINESEGTTFTGNTEDDLDTTRRAAYSLKRNNKHQDILFINGDNEGDSDGDDEFLSSVTQDDDHDGTKDEEAHEEGDERENELISEREDVQESTGESDYFPGGFEDKEGDEHELESAKGKESISQASEVNDIDFQDMKSNGDVSESVLNSAQSSEEVVVSEKQGPAGIEDSENAHGCNSDLQDIHISTMENNNADNEYVSESTINIDHDLVTLLNHGDVYDRVAGDTATKDATDVDEDRRHKEDSEHDAVDASDTDEQTEDVSVSSSSSDDDDPEHSRSRTGIAEGARDRECVTGHEYKMSRGGLGVRQCSVNGDCVPASNLENDGDKREAVHEACGVQERVKDGTSARGSMKNTSHASCTAGHSVSVPLRARGEDDFSGGKSGSTDPPEVERVCEGGSGGVWRGTLPPNTEQRGADVADGSRTQVHRHSDSRRREPDLPLRCDGYVGQEGGSSPARGV